MCGDLNCGFIRVPVDDQRGQCRVLLDHELGIVLVRDPPPQERQRNLRTDCGPSGVKTFMVCGPVNRIMKVDVETRERLSSAPLALVARMRSTMSRRPTRSSSVADRQAPVIASFSSATRSVASSVTSTLLRSVTAAPLCHSLATRPSCSSRTSASRTGPRLTRSRCEISASPMRSPGWSRPARIMSLIWSVTSSARLRRFTDCQPTVSC